MRSKKHYFGCILPALLCVGGIAAIIAVNANRGQASVERLERLLATNPTVEEVVDLAIELRLPHSVDQSRRRISVGVKGSSLPFEKTTFFEITFDSRRVCIGFKQSVEYLAP